MGRFLYIEDVIVHPSYRGIELGKTIINRLVEYLKENAPQKAFVGLLISEEKAEFYKKYDFKDYTTNMKGDFTVIRK